MNRVLEVIERESVRVRPAGLRIKSISIASLYRCAPVTMRITWAVSPVFLEGESGVKGVGMESFTRPADLLITIQPPSRQFNLEADILSAAWCLGAWDLRRLEKAPIANPSDYRDVRYGLTSDFSGSPYIISLNGERYPLAVGNPSADEEEQESHLAIMREAAERGWIVWSFVPLAFASDVMQSSWRDKDKTLDMDCMRQSRHITPSKLYHPKDALMAHEHIYQLGKQNHGNRGKGKSDRRG